MWSHTKKYQKSVPVLATFENFLILRYTFKSKLQRRFYQIFYDSFVDSIFLACHFLYFQLLEIVPF